jgi:nitrite reductase/ring-hydroxylating ferredoxin subunit
MKRFIPRKLQLRLPLPHEPQLYSNAALEPTFWQPNSLHRNFSTSFRPLSNMSKEYKLKNVSGLSLRPGDKQEVEVEGVDDAKVLLVNAAGSIQALGSRCTHYGAPLVNGVLTKEGRLTCPWHGGRPASIRIHFHPLPCSIPLPLACAA